MRKTNETICIKSMRCRVVVCGNTFVMTSPRPTPVRRRLTAMLWAAVAALTIALTAGATRADDIMLGDRQLSIAPSSGYCVLDGHNELEKIQLDLVDGMYRGTNNQLLAYWADCEVLARYRAGTTDTLSPYVIVLSVLHNGQVVPVDLPRDVFLQQMADVLGKGSTWQDILSNSAPEAERTLDSAIQKLTTDPDFKIKVGEVRSLGMVGRDKEAIYMGMVERVSAGSIDMMVAAVVGITEIKGLTVTVNVYSEFAGSQTFKTLRLQAHQLVHQLLTDNDDLS